jgi:FkbM family methyltransferase
LSAATDANDLSDYVDVIQVAVTDEIGEVSFADYGPFGTIGTERLNEAAGLPMITVRATTIDSFSQTPYDWIKMDIEGAECAAISGGSRTLRQARGLAVESNGYMLGQHGSSVGDLLGALKRLGYCPYSAAGETLSPIRPRIFQPEATLDYIAVPAGGQPFLPDGWVRGTARSRSELLRALVSELGHPSPQHRACALSVARRAPLWARWTPALRQAVRTLDADSHPDVVYARGRWRRHA